jgi:hypothetical protein
VIRDVEAEKYGLLVRKVNNMFWKSKGKVNGVVGGKPGPPSLLGLSSVVINVFCLFVIMSGVRPRAEEFRGTGEGTHPTLQVSTLSLALDS